MLVCTPTAVEPSCGQPLAQLLACSLFMQTPLTPPAHLDGLDSILDLEDAAFWTEGVHPCSVLWSAPGTQYRAGSLRTTALQLTSVILAAREKHCTVFTWPSLPHRLLSSREGRAMRCTCDGCNLHKQVLCCEASIQSRAPVCQPALLPTANCMRIALTQPVMQQSGDVHAPQGLVLCLMISC